MLLYKSAHVRPTDVHLVYMLLHNVQQDVFVKQQLLRHCI